MAIAEYLHLNLTNSFKDIIRDNGLIDTGELIDSIRVFVSVQNSIMTIRLGGADHLKYLIEPFRLLEQWSSSSRFNTIVEDIIQSLIETEMENILQGGVYDQSNIPNSIEVEVFYF